MQLAERRRKIETRLESLKLRLQDVLHGDNFKTPDVAVTFRTVKDGKTQIDDKHAFVDWAQKNRDDLLNYKAPEPNLTAIKKAIKAGDVIPFAVLLDSTSITVK